MAAELLLPPALTLLAQSTVILALGLLAVQAVRQRGPAAQSLLCRATLAAILFATLLSVMLAGHIAPLWRLSLPNRSSSTRQARQIPQAWQVAFLLPAPTTLPQATHPQPPPQGGGGESLARGRQDPLRRVDQSSSFRAFDRASRPLPPGEGVGGGSFAGEGLLAFWLIGTVLQLLWLTGCQLYLTRLRRRSHTIATGDAAEILAELCAARRLARPMLLCSPQARGPFLTGIRRPAIVLPAAYERDLDPTTLRAVLAHEAAHLARRDCAWLLLARLTCALLWPQLLVWLLARQLERTAEEACDWEAQPAAGSARAYANCLLRLAERSSAGRRESALSTAVLPFRSSLGRRIHALLQKGADPMPAPTPRLRAAVTLGAVAAAVLGVFLVSFGQSPPAPAPAQGNAQAQQQACLNNMRHLSIALLEYAQDNDGDYPMARNWEDAIYPYVKNKALFHDPAAPPGQQHSYAFNRSLATKPVPHVQKASHVAALFETTKNEANASDTGQSLPQPARHPDGNVYVLADGHVQTLPDSARPTFAATVTGPHLLTHREWDALFHRINVLRRMVGAPPQPGPPPVGLAARRHEPMALVPEYTKDSVRLYFLKKHMDSLRAPVYDAIQQQTQQRLVAPPQRNALHARDAAIAQRDAEITALKARIRQLERAQQSRQHPQSQTGAQRRVLAITHMQELMAQRQMMQMQLDMSRRNIAKLDSLMKNTSPQTVRHLDPHMRSQVQALQAQIAELRAKLLTDQASGYGPQNPTIVSDKAAVRAKQQELAELLRQLYVMAQINPQYLTLRNQLEAAVQQQQVARAEIATLNRQIAGLRSQR